VLIPNRVLVAERLAQALRSVLPQGRFPAQNIEQLKREGRP
jgi:hypothetical protein